MWNSPGEGKNMDIMIGIQGFGQYDAARRELERLAEEFDYKKTLPLGHQLISPLDGPWTNRQWEAFIEANTKKSPDWQEFEILPGGSSCSRFFGPGSLDDFGRFANRGMECLKKISKMKEDRTVILRHDLIVRLPSCQGYHGWLQLLYDTARAYSTPFFHAEPGYWGWTGQFPGEDSDPAHPFFEELRYDLFESSAEAIAMWLDPSDAICTGDRITNTPIYLPPESEKNGPYPPNKFWLWGECYEFSPKAWSLLEFVYGQDSVKKEHAIGHIYGGADDSEGAFDSTVKRLQTELGDQDCPADVHTKAGYIVFEVFKRD
jgi:hypothetical protein